MTSDAAVDALWPAGRPAIPPPRCRPTCSGCGGGCPTGSSSRPTPATGSTRRASTSTPSGWSRPSPTPPAVGGSARGRRIAAALAAWRGPAYPELADDRRRPGRGGPARRAARPSPSRGAPRRACGRRRRRRARRRASRPRRRAPAARAAPRAADEALGGHRPARRGAARLRRLPPAARRRAGHRAVAGARRPARRAARRDGGRGLGAAGTGCPSPATSLVGRDELVAEACALVERRTGS